MEPSTGELERRLSAVQADLKEDMHQIASRLDAKVSSDVLDLQQRAQDERVVALGQRVTALEEAAKEGARQRAQDRRLVLTALAVPLLLLLLQVYLTSRGAQ